MQPGCLQVPCTSVVGRRSGTAETGRWLGVCNFPLRLARGLFQYGGSVATTIGRFTIGATVAVIAIVLVAVILALVR